MNFLVIALLTVLAWGLLAVLLRKRLPRLAKGIAVFAVVFLLVVTVGAGICYDAPQADADYDPDYAVLLGLGLENGQPKPELVSRMTLALRYLEENPDVTSIVTGGDPAGQGVTEAEVMYSWLRENGADMSRVYPEDQARNTVENFQNSKELAESLGLETENILILTSDYHQTRARFLADKLGQNAQGLSSETPSGHLSAAVREVFAFIPILFG